MEYDNTFRIPVLKGKPEYIADFGCQFAVYRTTTSKKVISVSLWKQSAGYVPALSYGLLWWSSNIKKLFPGYNIRIFLDSSVYKPFRGYTSKDLKDLAEIEKINEYERKHGEDSYTDWAPAYPEEKPQFGDDVDWDKIVNSLYKNPNVELWLHNCSWGKLGKGKGKNYTGTFGSLVRFQPLFDKNVDITIVRNLELLSSKYDAKTMKDWENSGRQYHLYMIQYQYGCFEDVVSNKTYLRLCKDAGLNKRRMLLAGWFASKGTWPHSKFERMMSILNHLRFDYSYGVDEVVLTKLIFTDQKEPKMTMVNTNLTFLFTMQGIVQFFQYNKDFMDFMVQNIDKWRASCSHVDNAFWENLQEQIVRNIKTPGYSNLNMLFRIANDRSDLCWDMEEDCQRFFAKMSKNASRLPCYSAINNIMSSYVKNVFFRSEDMINTINSFLNHTGSNMAYASIMQKSSFQTITFPGFAFKSKDYRSHFKEHKGYIKYAHQTLMS